MTYLSPYWKEFVADLAGAGITDLSKVVGDRVLTNILNGPLTVSGSVQTANPQVWTPYDGDGYDDPYLSEGTRLMWWFRRESDVPPYYVPRAAVLVDMVQDDAQQDDARTRFVGHDPWMLMFSRLVRNEDGSLVGKDGISWNDTKVSVIVCEILRNTINYPTPGAGHAFIDAGNGDRVGEGSQYQDWGGTEWYAGTLDADPVVDWNIPQGTSVGQAWQQLCQAGECDILLRPIYDPMLRPNYLVEISVLAQAGVTNDTAIFAWNLPGRSLVGLSRQQDGSQRANRIYDEAGQGGTAAVAPVQEDAASIAKYGPYEARQFYPGLTGGGALAAATSLAQQQLALRATGKQTVTFRPAPERSPRPWQDYDLGDRVPVWADPSGFRQLLGDA